MADEAFKLNLKERDKIILDWLAAEPEKYRSVKIIEADPEKRIETLLTALLNGTQFDIQAAPPQKPGKDTL